jgi:hypothetical protein
MYSRKTVSGFLMLVVLFWLPIRGLSQTTNNHFAKFEWAGAEFNKVFYPKASILVPVKVAGTAKKLFAQLDTGCNGTFFYGKILEKHGVKFDSDEPSSINFSWMGLSEIPALLTDSAFISWSSFEDASVDPSSVKPEDRIVGTIGLDKIVGKILILNFPKNEYAIFSDSSELPVYLKDNLGYVPAVIDNARFYVSIVIGKDTLKNIFYDTGASMSTLTLPLEDWRKATGLRGNEPEIIRDSVFSWGKKIEVLKAYSKADLRFGSLHIKSPMVEHVEWTDTSFNNYRLLGNAPFYDDYIVAVDCKYSRMGVAKVVEDHDREKSK